MGILQVLTSNVAKVTDKLSHMNGISTPFFGISWDNVTDVDKLNIVCELYMVRKVLADYTCPFSVNYNNFLELEALENDKPTREMYLQDNKDELFSACEKLEDQLYRSSAYVKTILLNGNKLESWVGIFDFVRTLKANLALDSDSADFEDLLELHDFIVTCQNDLMVNIGKIPIDKLRLK